MQRILIARISGVLLLMVVAAQVVTYLWTALVPQKITFSQGMPLSEEPALLVFAVVALVGLVVLQTQQRSCAGQLAGMLTILGFALNAVVVLVFLPTLEALLSVGAVIDLTGFIMYSGQIMAFAYSMFFGPLAVAELLPLARFTGGLIYCGLAARRDGSLRVWWAPLALGVGNLVAVVVTSAVLFTDQSLFVTLVGPISTPNTDFNPIRNLILLLTPISTLLWALLGLALLKQPEVRDERRPAEPLPSLK